MAGVEYDAPLAGCRAESLEEPVDREGTDSRLQLADLRAAALNLGHCLLVTSD
jgi:hypothetical protein